MFWVPEGPWPVIKPWSLLCTCKFLVKVKITFLYKKKITLKNSKLSSLLTQIISTDSRGRQVSLASPVVKARPLLAMQCISQHRVPLTVSFTVSSRWQAHTADFPPSCRNRAGHKQGPCNDLAGLRLQYFDTGSVTLSGKSSESWAVRFGGRAVSGAGL